METEISFIGHCRHTGSRQSHHFFIGHDLVGLHLCKIVARFIGDEGTSPLADIQYGRNPDGFARLRGNESRGSFSGIFHAQGAMPDGAICRCGETVCKPAVCFSDDEESLTANVRLNL